MTLRAGSSPLYADGLFKRSDELQRSRPLARHGRNDVAMQKITHDAVSDRPVVSLAMEMEYADVLVTERGLCTEHAKSHQRSPC
jgi:hypothetical protein